MGDSGDSSFGLSLASKDAEAVPDLGSIDNGSALDAELDFVAAFMMALTQGVPKGKEDKDLIRQRKERKRQINRASAKRKRARAKQEFDDLAAQCQQLEESNRQLKNDNARLAGVMRDELEKQAMYMAQIEYIKAALQQQSQGDANTEASEPGGTSAGARMPSTPIAPPAPSPTPLMQSPSELQPTHDSSGASVQHTQRTTGQARQEVIQEDRSRSETSQELQQAQQQEMSPQSFQQQLQALASLICAAAMPSSQGTVNSTVPGSGSLLSVSGETPGLNQATLNQLQTLLTALVSQNPVASSNPPSAATAFDMTSAMPPGVQNPVSVDASEANVVAQGAASPDSAPQLHSFLTALATASASLTGNVVFGGQPTPFSTTLGNSQSMLSTATSDAAQGEQKPSST